MKNFQFVAVATIIFLLHKTTADISADAPYLHRFALLVPRVKKLNWNSIFSICEWDGITCEGTKVVQINLPSKGLFGPIPPNTIGKLDSLKVLSLRYNFLSGPIPVDIISNPSLQNLYLQHNRFSGNIPTPVSPKIMVLDLSFNSLTGNIPESLKDLSRLTTLNLQFNSFSGPVPDFLGTRLRELDVSHNKLDGSIPYSLQTFDSSSFSGNQLLCGPPLSNPCPPSVALSPKKLTTAAIVAIAIGSFLLVMILLCCFLKKNDRDGRGVDDEGRPS